MKRVIIASTNPVKVNCTRDGFARMLPAIEKESEFVGVSVPSGVADQPITDEETLTGARNRATAARELEPNADFWIGIEGGIERRDASMVAFAWVVILSQNKQGESRTATFQLPPKIVELIDEGMELGHADDMVFNRSNSKQSDGAVGILTDGLIDRTTYYTEAVTLALIPFKNSELY